MSYAVISMVYRFWRRYALVVQSLKQQTLPPDQILAVHHETDPVPDVVKGLGVIPVCVSGPVVEKANYYNAGARSATTDRLLFLDADTVLAPDTCAILFAALDKNPGAIHTSCRYVIDVKLAEQFLVLGYTPARFHYFFDRRGKTTYVEKFFYAKRSKRDGGGLKECPYSHGHIQAMTRDVFDLVGGYPSDKEHGTIPDYEFAVRSYQRLGRDGWVIHEDARLLHLGHHGHARKSAVNESL